MTTLDQETLVALAADLEDRCVALYLAGMRITKSVAKALAAEEGVREVTPEFLEMVRRCWKSDAFMGKVLEAKENMPLHAQKAVLALAPMAVKVFRDLLSDANEDKRTKNSVAQYVLGAGAGVTPTQRHEVTATEEFLRLQREMFGKREEPEGAESPGGTA